MKFIAWGLAAVIALAWWVQAYLPERDAYTLALTYFALPQGWLALALVVLAVSLWRGGRWAVLGSFVALALAFVLLGGVWSSPPRQAGGGAALRLLTYNVEGGRGDLGEVARTLRALKPDVMCLQEVYRTHMDVLGTLAPLLPDYQLLPSREVAILTRLKAHDVRDLALPVTDRRFVVAELTWHGQPFTLLNAHFTTVETKGGAGTIQRTAEDRRVTLGRLLDIAGETSGPFIACGDFNTPTRGAVYAGLESHFANAFEQAGRGFGYTYPNTFPLVRIDHVWLRGARALSARVLNVKGSDHRPLLVDLELER